MPSLMLLLPVTMQFGSPNVTMLVPTAHCCSTLLCHCHCQDTHSIPYRQISCTSSLHTPFCLTQPLHVIHCRQLQSASSDSTEWVTKYQKAEDGRSAAVAEKDRLQAQLSQAEQRASQAEGRLSSAQQQASDAQASLASLRGQFAPRLREAHAQADSAVPGPAPAPGGLRKQTDV